MCMNNSSFVDSTIRKDFESMMSIHSILKKMEIQNDLSYARRSESDESMVPRIKVDDHMIFIVDENGIQMIVDGNHKYPIESIRDAVHNVLSHLYTLNLIETGSFKWRNPQ